MVVRATAPVANTFVDLHGTWRLELHEAVQNAVQDAGGEQRAGSVLVQAPNLRFNKPAVDVSRLRWQVVQGSLLRDEAEVQTQLQREITGRSAIQAVTNLPLVRETARAQVARFVREWLLRMYPDADRYQVQVSRRRGPAWRRRSSLTPWS